jgi:hypothetical protein
MTTDPQAFDEDEDLFDFPDVAGLQPLTPEPVSAEAEPAPEPTEEPAAADEPVEAEVLPAEPIEIPPAIAALAAEDEGEDDEDLFAFEELLLDPIVIEEPEPAREVAAPAPQAAAPAPAPAPAAPSTPVAAPTHRAPVEDEAEEEGEFDLEALLASLPQGQGEPAPRGRMIEILALCFLVANTALVLFAWRAGDDFRSTLDHVGDAVTSAVAEGQVRAATEVAAQLRAQVPAAPAPTEVRVELPVVPAPDLATTGLDLAREALDAGRFEDARQGLARLLANRDRAALPEELVLEARRLVALSYHLQGQALARGEQ